MEKNLKIIRRQLYLIAGIVVFLLQNQVSAQKLTDVVNPPRILEFLGDQPMTRVGRPFVVLASVSNPATTPVNISVTLKMLEYKFKVLTKL